jgi:proteasome component ECM29
VLDDIKETVRVAAAALARVLTSILTRSLEAGDASIKSATIQLQRVIPFLFSTSGLESSAEEVRLFSVNTVLQIVKKSNAKTLNPHVPDLVERLLGLLSSLEPEAVNYIHMNASKYNLTEQKIDDMRLASVRSSPLTESLERCLDLADADTMSALVSRSRYEERCWSTVQGGLFTYLGYPCYKTSVPVQPLRRRFPQTGSKTHP